MNESELRSKYVQGVRIIKAAPSGLPKQREWVFRNDPVKLNAKLVEIDMLLRIFAEFKDALKPHCEPGVEQMALLDPPVRYE